MALGFLRRKKNQNQEKNPGADDEESENKFSFLCPNCLEPIRSYDAYCPSCWSPIFREEFTSYKFLLKNSILFALIGVIGTITALLPTIAEKFYPGTALSALPWPQNFFLLSSIVLDSLMITFMISLLLAVSLDKRENECVYWHRNKSPILRITKGDPDRFIFYLFFLTPIFTTVVFISNIFPTLRDLIFVFYVLLLVFALFLSATIILKEGRGKKVSAIITGIIFVILLIWMIFSMYSVTPKPIPPLTDVTPSDIAINYDMQYFTTSTPLAYGIGLTPANLSTLSTRNFSSTKISWNTNYGYFTDLSDNGRMIILGNSTIHDQNKIYWTHSSKDISDLNKTIMIDMWVNESSDGTPIANRTVFLKWVDNDLIKVIQ